MRPARRSTETERTRSRTRTLSRRLLRIWRAPVVQYLLGVLIATMCGCDLAGVRGVNGLVIGVIALVLAAVLWCFMGAAVRRSRRA